MNKSRLLIIGIILFIAAVPLRLTIGYFNSYQYSLDKRQTKAEQEKNLIDIAIVWSLEVQDSFIKGVKLAIAEENEKGIIIKEAGEKYKLTITPHYFDDSTTKKNANSIHQIVKNKKIMSVIGHSSSANAAVASVSYEQHGILFLSTVATDQKLTNHGFNYMFSTIPIDKEYTQALVDFCIQKGYKKIAVFYSRDGAYGLNLYNNFSSLLYGKDIDIVFSRSFNSEQTNYLEPIYEMLESHPQAILLGATERNAAQFIEQLRTLGVKRPVISGDGIDNPFIWQMSNNTAYNTFVASIYIDSPFSANTNIAPEFYDAFFARYAYAPDYLALQGYDAIKILVAAIRRSNSKNPLILAATLKYNFDNAYNNYKFNSLGRILNKKIVIKEMKEGGFYEIKQEN
ncbi:MAG: ABC transporter substrate-binding protein [Methylococcaceae bacterium]|nr:ABC transporter substrate-binding protein [Methylococcaceae bacterium]